MKIRTPHAPAPTHPEFVGATTFDPWPFADSIVKLSDSVLYYALRHGGAPSRSRGGYHLSAADDTLAEFSDGTLVVTAASRLDDLIASVATHGTKVTK